MKTEKVDLPRTQAGHSLPCECGVRQLEAARGRGQVMAGQATFPFAMNEQRAVVWGLLPQRRRYARLGGFTQF